MIRPVKHEDCEDIVAIYNHYIENSSATFEELSLTGSDIANRLADVQAQGLPWLVAEEEGVLQGYAYANKWRERSAYRFSVESTVYLAPDSVGSGWGTALYSELFDQLRALELHAVIGGITLPNPASVALHEKMGMHKVAHFPEVGRKQGQWLDVGYWQINL